MQMSLRAARTNKELTQAAMAELLGISRETYVKIEADPARASVRMAQQIIDVLGVEVRCVFLPDDSTARYSS